MLQNEKTDEGDWGTDSMGSETDVSFFKNTIVRTISGITLFFLCISFGILGYFVRPSENLFILHYNVYFGVEIQGIWWQVFILPVAGTLFFFGHLFFAHYFYGKSERIAAYLMLFGAWFISVGIVIASVGIIFINY